MIDDLINKVTCGEAIETMKGIPDKAIDMILCDLPYGTTACSWDTIIPFEPLWEAYKRIIKDNGAIVLTASQPFTTKLIQSNFDWFKYCWYWEKERGTGFQFSAYQPLRIIEECIVFCNGVPIYNPIKLKLARPYSHILPRTKTDTLGELETMKNGQDTYKTYEDSFPNNLIRFKREKNNDKLHPTQKPTDLFEYLIKTYTNENDLVLDNCAGSFTTCVAAKRLHRRWIGIELSEDYCKIGRQRLAQGVLDI